MAAGIAYPTGRPGERQRVLRWDVHRRIVCQDLVAGGTVPTTSGGSGWDLLGRWPHGGSLVAVGSTIPATVDVHEAEHRGNSGLPIQSWALSPVELDHMLGGGLFAGPWGGYVALQWPPPEPEGEETEGIGPLPFDDGAEVGQQPDSEFATDAEDGAGAFQSAAEDVTDLLGLEGGPEEPSPAGGGAEPETVTTAVRGRGAGRGGGGVGPVPKPVGQVMLGGPPPRVGSSPLPGVGRGRGAAPPRAAAAPPGLAGFNLGRTLGRAGATTTAQAVFAQEKARAQAAAVAALKSGPVRAGGGKKPTRRT
jgi:hypothetical protein